ncbi:MAG TPA: leucine-rich repeat domain-containing protein [Gemmataceae bacterium]|jgi:putative heme-binding domain-containing protein
MRTYAWIVWVVVVPLVVGSRLGAEESNDRQRAIAALLKRGAVIGVDTNHPDKPVVGVDLNFTWAGDAEMELLKAFPELRTVKLREGFNITEKGMRFLAGLTQLQELDLGKGMITSEGLKHLQGLTNLRSLNLSWNNDVTDEGLRYLRRLTNLRRLDLAFCTDITDKGVAHLQGLTNLQQLDLDDTKISDDGLVCLKDLRHLNTLSLHGTRITDKGLTHLEDLTKLQSLDLGWTRITDKGLRHLKGLTDLRTLDIDATEAYGEGLEYLKELPRLRTLRLGGNVQGEDLPSLKGLTRLRELSFASARFEDESWKHLGELTSLQSLRIDRARWVTDEGLSHLRRLTNLRSLHLSHTEHMTDATVKQLTGLTDLTHLVLRGLDHISDDGVQQLGRLTNLESLEIGSIPVTDKGLEFLRELQNLRVLIVENVPITDETLKQLKAANLQQLKLAGTEIGDSGMIFLMELSHLQILDFSRTSISNRGLSHLASLRKLITIIVEDSGVTDAGVQNFRERRPDAKVIQYLAKQTAYIPSSEKKPSPPPSRRLVSLVEVLADSNDESMQLDVLRGMREALQGRRQVTAPEGWSTVYRKLAGSKNAEVREKVLQLSVLFGDPQALAALRETAADAKGDASARRNALQTLVEKRPPDLLPLLRKLLGDRALCGLALRGLASYNDPATPTLILEHYAAFTDAEKADAIATLASRPKYALALLDAMEKGRVPRRDLSAFTVRQLLTFNDKNLSERLTKVWGSIRPPSQEKTAQLAKYKAMAPADALKKADRKHGRLLFSRTCASCHTLFGEGGKIGPDLTGSQRANPEYLLTKLLDPSAVVARDYQMTVISTKAGRTVSGLVKEESDKTLTLQTQNEVVRFEKTDIEERNRSSQSMMPDGLLAMLSPAEVRDLIAYLSGPSQVPLPPEPRK